MDIIEFEDLSSGREYVAMYNSKRISTEEVQRYLQDIYPLGQHPCVVVMSKRQYQNLGFSENAAAEKSNAAGNEPSPVYAHWINPSKNPEYVNSEFFSDCSRCGHTSSEEEPVCPNCGAIMENPSDAYL